MLNEMLKKPVKRIVAMYYIGRVLGIFPKDSYEQYEYLLKDDQDNEINSLLTSILSSLQHDMMVSCVEDEESDDMIQWNDSFKVDTHLQKIEKKKEEKKRRSESLAKAKAMLRKRLQIGEMIGKGFKMKVISFDLNEMSITTEILNNAEWEHVFNVGYKAVWRLNGEPVSDFVLFEAEPELDTGNSAQSLLYLIDGNFSVERDS